VASASSGHPRTGNPTIVRLAGSGNGPFGGASCPDAHRRITHCRSAAGDFHRDGLATWRDRRGGGAVQDPLTGKGDGTFDFPRSQDNRAADVTVADFNGDNRPSSRGGGARSAGRSNTFLRGQ